MRAYLAEQAARASAPPPARGAAGAVQYADTACAVPGGMAQGVPAAAAPQREGRPPPPAATAASYEAPPAVVAAAAGGAQRADGRSPPPSRGAAGCRPHASQHSATPPPAPPSPAPQHAPEGRLSASREGLAGLLDDVRQERARMQGQFDAHLALLTRQRDDTAVELRHMRVRAALYG